MPPPLVRVVIACFWLLLLDSQLRRLQEMQYVAVPYVTESHVHGSRSIPMTIHTAPVQIPTTLDEFRALLFIGENSV